MKRATRVPLLCVILLLSISLHPILKGCATFALSPTYRMREKEGLGRHSDPGHFRSPVNSSVEIELATEEKELASHLKIAGDGEPGQWQKVYAKYMGSNTIVLNAAMQAALKQRDFKEGLKIFENIREKTRPTCTIAMKLFGKLGQLDKVEELWTELDQVDQVAAQARIDASADNGDAEGAMQVLDYMHQIGLEANVLHFSSAINACANAKGADFAKSAQGLVDTMVARGVQRNIITYTNLLRALRQEPKQQLLSLLVEMESQNIGPDTLFAQSFLFILLKKPPKSCWDNIKDIAAHLKTQSVADLQAAKDSLDHMRDAKVRLNKSCKLIDAALQRVLSD
ncbi:unnamed protein product [Durusdinium trenchii]|uniref:Pentacotripeptide-repeat region of PRORP domain-containing protein n=2 Tax=Durusdinium trenchii TaxID=1381693 RepID=A0ABP0M1A1_9DINO